MIIKMTELKGNENEMYHGMWAKDIYMKKGTEIIGLHALGEKDVEWDVINLDGTRTKVKGFKQWEHWGNEYDENHKMVGRGSFRVHDDIEKVAKLLEEDGWVSYEGPKRIEEPSKL